MEKAAYGGGEDVVQGIGFWKRVQIPGVSRAQHLQRGGSPAGAGPGSRLHKVSSRPTLAQRQDQDRQLCHDRGRWKAMSTQVPILCTAQLLDTHRLRLVAAWKPRLRRESRDGVENGTGMIPQADWATCDSLALKGAAEFSSWRPSCPCASLRFATRSISPELDTASKLLAKHVRRPLQEWVR